MFQRNNNNRKSNNRHRGSRPRHDERSSLQFTPQGEKIDALIRHAGRLVRMLAGRHSAGELLASQVQPKTIEEELRARLQPDMRALAGEFAHTLDRITSGGDDSLLRLWLRELTIGHTDATHSSEEGDGAQIGEETADPALTEMDNESAASQTGSDPAPEQHEDDESEQSDD